MRKLSKHQMQITEVSLARVTDEFIATVMATDWELDGASEFAIYRTLVLRLCRPILVTLGLFTFMGAWNDFLWPLVVLADETRYTLPVGLASLAGEHVQDTELMMAGSVLTVAPVLLLFVCLQRYYVDSVTAGALKE